eukprot:12333630-Prorocentrum_lima.AAC.1
MTSSLVGSEMCIRDRPWGLRLGARAQGVLRPPLPELEPARCRVRRVKGCLLYTSDAADDM